MIQRFTGHFHTIVGHFMSFPKIGKLAEKHFIEMLDGDRLVGYLFRGTSNVVISLYHGLSGDVDADYMQRTASHYLDMGHSVFLVNHRGVGEGSGLAKKPYHSGRAEDISQVIGYLRDLLPGKKQITAGFSMSGNIVLYLLTGQRGQHLPDGAITVNAPINLDACSVKLTSGFNRLYDLRFVSRLKEQQNLDISRWAKLTEVDDRFTAPLSGFKDRNDYYQTCSAKQYVQDIKTPTFVLTAEDDPFIPVQDYREAKWPSAVQLHIQKRGGHLGYVSATKNSLGSHSWLDEYMVASLNSLLKVI